MKKLIYKIFILTIVSISLSSCEENEIPIFDTENGRSIAGFGGGNETPRIVFNPASETESLISIGVSTLSDNNRSVQLSIDNDKSTLDPSFYSISTLNPTIAAGEFTTDIVITTIPGTELPSASDVLILKLDSVEDSEILDNSVDELSIGLDVQCPSVDLSNIPGSYEVTNSSFADFFGETDFNREIIAGPGTNQFTIVGGTYITENAENLIFTVDPETGEITSVDETKISSQVSFGPNTYAFKPGGRVLTCVGIVELNLDFGGSVSGNPHDFDLIKL
ncbi:hypothetical protein [Abyssalbus ytuae]|uniref:Uncharacterized protein n=1 Tax=Abyssalbus ytuae TaxID=2926907 RepID=A0A9E7D0U1_9FLAO|nr:hypothetical protein [Abyssalbus ytuae]UOB16373.1 hypothetical protein MQE35_11570 [Abyssalbus ytuae]